MSLVTGTAASNVGRHVLSQVLGTSAAVRALTRNPHSAGLPGDLVRGELSVPDTLDVCLLWSFFTAAPAFLDAVTKHARRIVYLLFEGEGSDLESQTCTIAA